MTKTTYDPNVPISFTSFMPDSGGIRDKFILKGSNFGSDTSKVKVYFIDEEKERKATLINMNNETIYCIVPKQLGGDNLVKVKVESDSATSDSTFHYTVAESVSNVVGLSGTAGSVDGTLSDGRIQRTFGIAALGDDELISFETLSKTVRYISVNDNIISTLQTGFGAAQPAITKDRNTLYAIEAYSPHRVVRYTREGLWQPEIMSSGLYRSNGNVVAGAIFAAALDDSEEWLYFRDRYGVFGRMEIANPTNVEILNESCGPSASSDYNYLIYSPVDDCFFFSVQYLHEVYKVGTDAQNPEIYAGSTQGSSDGSRLEAKFNSPTGFNVDSEGNLYVVDSNNHTIRKINHSSGYVSLIAGTTGVAGGDNGDPLKSTFSYPYCISVDESDNMFIGESWGTTIRKLAIE
ncbi:MAG: IPT/TIG domain-containing protein [Chitinophagaceae bacterium]